MASISKQCVVCLPIGTSSLALLSRINQEQWHESKILTILGGARTRQFENHLELETSTHASLFDTLVTWWLGGCPCCVGWGGPLLGGLGVVLGGSFWY